MKVGGWITNNLLSKPESPKYLQAKIPLFCP